VYAVIIDAPEAEADRAARFWAAALGVEARPFAPAPQFTSLPGALPGLVGAVQAVDDAPRIHLDIETDDLEAEVGRLTGPGAEPVARWQECQVLRAPGGHLVRVLPQESDAETIRATAAVWP
jgi:hypothetical protein